MVCANAGQEGKSTMQDVQVERGRFGLYRPYLDEANRALLDQAAGALRGARVLHINATPSGGGVAEILASEVPLLRVPTNVRGYRNRGGKAR